MQAQIFSILYTAFVMWLTATLIMLIYSFRSNHNTFDLNCWFKTNTNRFKVGAIVIATISILIVVEPDIAVLLQVLGFNAKASPLPLGIALGTLLIAGVPGNKPKKETPSVIPTEENNQNA